MSEDVVDQTLRQFTRAWLDEAKVTGKRVHPDFRIDLRSDIEARRAEGWPLAYEYERRARELSYL